MNDPVDGDWIQRQNRIIATIKFRALSSHKVNFKRPDIIPAPKEGKCGEYRVLAVYTLEDKILIGQCAAYLRAIFEGYFLPCSFAFRYSTKDRNPPTHHDAFRELANFWNENQEQGSVDAWAAECDIQGFFDTVCHQIVLREFDTAVTHFAHRGRYIDARSRSVILGYLRSYSYGGFGAPEARRILARFNGLGTVADRSPVLVDLHASLDHSRIGVPQGGALSCFFPNLILHRADEVMLEVAGKYKGKMTYVRYCDDMVIVGRNLSAVNEAVAKYCVTLKSLKLPTHELASIGYGRGFWKMKSKAPYRWGKLDDGNNVPWLAFVGYQLRYDGMIRIRPSSVTRELKKQVKVTDAFIAHVIPALMRKKVHRNWRRMLSSLSGRLEAMSVGRRSEWDFEWHAPSECWCSGFECLSDEMFRKKKKMVITQLRRLDRNKGRQLARAERRLSRFCIGLGQPAQKKRSVTPHSGKPQSYNGQFEDSSMS